MKHTNTIISIFLFVLLTSCSNFEQEAKPLYKDLINLYELSLSKCKTTQSVWRTAIYDERYTLGAYQKISDFNSAQLRDAQGRVIATISSKEELVFNTNELAPGYYFVEIEHSNHVYSKTAVKL